MSNSHPSPLQQRVSAGAEMLDKYHPGWANKIDLDRLQMELCSACVLGQLFDDYHRGMLMLHVPIERWLWGLDTDRPSAFAIAHGFQSERAADDKEYDRLREAWIPLIQQRQAG